MSDAAYIYTMPGTEYVLVGGASTQKQKEYRENPEVMLHNSY